MARIWVAIGCFLVGIGLSPSAWAHRFSDSDGCCTWTYDDCTARPGHPEERCRPGHHLVEIESHGCLGVACHGDASCFPVVATGADQEIANGIDDDCDGFIDDEQCDNFDNDGDGVADEDIGSCLLRMLVVPLCFSGADGAFRDAAEAEVDDFFRRAGVDMCPDNIQQTVMVPSQLELSCGRGTGSCSGFTKDLSRQLGNAGVDVTQFDMVVAITNQDLCGSMVGQNGGDVLWLETGEFFGILAHEAGHSFDLADEYCSQLAFFDFDDVDERCNTSSPPAPPPPNWLGSDLGCDPSALSECCEDFCESYEVCCEGNKTFNIIGEVTGTCIMSSADDEDPFKGYCDRCWNHLHFPANMRSETNPLGQMPLDCSFAHLGSMPIMRAAMAVKPDGTFELDHYHVNHGRLGVRPQTTQGRYGLEVLSPADVLLFATSFDAYFDSADPKIRGVSYEGITRETSDQVFRIPVLPDSTNSSVFTLKTYRDGIPAGQTTINGRAPTANAGPDLVVECNQTLAATTTLDGRASSDPDGDTLHYEWSGQGTFVDPRVAQPTVTIPMGPSALTLVVSDGLLRSAPDSTVLTVVDRTPPEIAPPGPVAVAGCAASNAFTFVPPVVSDICSPNVTVRGFVIRRNGVAINPPTALVNNATTLTPGIYVIEWRATDGFNNESRLSQTVTVRPAVQTANTLLLRDRARANSAPGVLGPIWNRGSALTELGVEARSANIVSVGRVSLRDRAVVSGSILSAGSVTRGNSTTVSGPITQFGTVVLPPLPTLSSFNPGTGSTFVNPGSPAALSSGSHGAFTVNSGGRLELSVGDHFFSSLTINSAATVIASAQTRVFVAGAAMLRSPFLLNGSTSALAPIFLGLATTGSVIVETAFDGTVLAPSAFVTFGIGSGLTYRGLFYARSIEVRPDTVLQCAAAPIPQ